MLAEPMTPEQQLDYWIGNEGHCYRDGCCTLDKCIYKRYMVENDKPGCKITLLYEWALKQRGLLAEGHCQSIW